MVSLLLSYIADISKALTLSKDTNDSDFLGGKYLKEGQTLRRKADCKSFKEFGRYYPGYQTGAGEGGWEILNDRKWNL